MTGDIDIRHAVESALGSLLSEHEWALLEQEGFVGELQHYFAGDEWASPDAFDAVVTKIQRMRSTYRGEAVEKKRGRFLTQRQRSEPGDPIEALSALVALQAAEDPEVVRFREEALKSVLLPLAQVGDWVKARFAEEGRSTYLEIDWPPGMSFAWNEETARMGLIGLPPSGDLPLTYFRVRHDFLIFPTEHLQLDMVEVKRDGVLDRLRHLGIRLGKRYSWEEAEAVGFALTGVPPHLRGVTAKVDYHEEFPAVSALAVRVPVLATVAEAEKLLQWLRQRVLASAPRRRSKKHLALAVFAAERRAGGESWSQVMAAWNTERAANYLKGHYRDERLFARDASKAQKGLLEPGIDRDALWEREGSEDSS